MLIPNKADAAFPDQAKLDSRDIEIIAAASLRTGVLSGCAVTAHGSPDMSVAVAAGQVIVGNKVVTVTAGDVAITASSGNPRFDFIVVNNAGVKSAVVGTASANPVFPAVPANSVVLAAIFVAGGSSTVTTNEIIDKRMMLAEPFRAYSRAKAGATTYYNLPGVNITGGGATQVTAADRVYYYPFKVEQEITIDQMAMNITAAGAAGKLGRMGIYKADVDWQPLARLYDSGTFAIDSTGVKTAAPALTLTPGRYLNSFQTDGTPTIRIWPSSQLMAGMDTTLGSSSAIQQMFKNQAFAAYADPGVLWDTIASGASFQNPIFLRMTGINF